MNLGERLYELRKSKGLSQESAADILGVTRQTVSKWETNQTTPDFDKILPICRLYEISTDELLTGEKVSSDNKHFVQSAENEHKQNEESENDYYEQYRYKDTHNNTYTCTYENASPYADAYSSSDSADNHTAELALKQKRVYASLLSAAIFLYILSPVPFFFSSELSSSVMMTLFFIIIAVATMIIVFACVSRVRMRVKTQAQDSQITKSQKLYKQITDVLSLVTVAIYLAVSFITRAWGITWILWIIYALICKIIKLAFSLKGEDIDEKN